jgi:hypothetical protein
MHSVAAVTVLVFLHVICANALHTYDDYISADLPVQNFNTFDPTQVLLRLYHSLLENSTSLQSPYQLVSYTQQQILIVLLDLKRSFENILCAIALYATIFGILSTIANVTKSRKLHKLSDVFGDVGIESALLLRAMFRALTKDGTRTIPRSSIVNPVAVQRVVQRVIRIMERLMVISVKILLIALCTVTVLYLLIRLKSLKMN